MEVQDISFQIKDENLPNVASKAIELSESWEVSLDTGCEEWEIVDKAFEYLGFLVDYDTFGLSELTWVGEYYTFEMEEFFKAIAPFVVEGSFIEFYTEDDDDDDPEKRAYWHWLFNGKSLEERSGSVEIAWN